MQLLSKLRGSLLRRQNDACIYTERHAAADRCAGIIWGNQLDARKLQLPAQASHVHAVRRCASGLCVPGCRRRYDRRMISWHHDPSLDV